MNIYAYTYTHVKIIKFQLLWRLRQEDHALAARLDYNEYQANLSTFSEIISQDFLKDLGYSLV